MQKNQEPVYYGDYLQLDKLLAAQAPHSSRYGETAHDETLFIIVHQVYELWFKQVLHELGSVMDTFSEQEVKDQQLTTVVHRLRRIITIQELMNDQIGVMETMTPQEFLTFRDYLIPASGFQSIQFKRLEISLGLKRDYRIDFDKQSFYQRLEEQDRHYLEKLENRPSLFELVESWLERMPLLEFGDFKFWELYNSAATAMLAEDEQTVQSNQTLNEKQRETELEGIEQTKGVFNALLDDKEYKKLQQKDELRLSQRAMLSSLFICQYQEEPLFNLPYQLITCLTEIDEKLTIWRYRHAMMVQRMLGSKIGTGGSSGHEYLKRTTESNRIFKDFFNMSTFLLPKKALPDLPQEVRESLGFHLSRV
ncbi:Tryptophan 2,3-dioxygenase [Saliniradius amylolyticus]|uniref:Tryptophan 2,3-dioxygenase n=1 Tax=Saliniradius amylolyticus TaxID=2183582 RepID=A0A2S2E180_9ALTE|nr:tryptophan 2,3-dioxygenase family protein [Saliniradius amylolyticus]AWL11349.1 Tryptophan 2,3-dioxygenase [Saliniradius amylolyticus]